MEKLIEFLLAALGFAVYFLTIVLSVTLFVKAFNTVNIDNDKRWLYTAVAAANCVILYCANDNVWILFLLILPLIVGFIVYLKLEKKNTANHIKHGNKV